MGKLICGNCKKVYETSEKECPHCHLGGHRVYDFTNSDEYLKEMVPKVMEERKNAGLEGLVGGLECIIINTEEEHQKDAVSEFLRFTGLECAELFQNARFTTCVLRVRGSADVLVQSRRSGTNPFLPFNDFQKSRHLPNTRLETLVFRTRDVEKYVAIQKSRGMRFLTNDIVHTDNYSFIQTAPSPYTSNSLGFIEWHNGTKKYGDAESEELPQNLQKPDSAPLKNIGKLDHAATRVKAEERDAAIIEFMELTNYHFDFAIYVKMFNSITNVARLTSKDFAMVFTSGISSYVNEDVSGPTETFIHNYGKRVHHLAFRTDHIEDTFASLENGGMKFLLGLVGSPEEGLKQTFSHPSPHTLLVSEYIHRYGDFEGFFTKNNVTLLTEATGEQ